MDPTTGRAKSASYSFLPRLDELPASGRADGADSPRRSTYGIQVTRESIARLAGQGRATSPLLTSQSFHRKVQSLPGPSKTSLETAPPLPSMPQFDKKPSNRPSVERPEEFHDCLTPDDLLTALPGNRRQQSPSLLDAPLSPSWPLSGRHPSVIGMPSLSNRTSLSLDLDGPPPPKSLADGRRVLRRKVRSQRNGSWWPVELFAWAASLVLSVAAVIVIAIYDDKPIPKLHFGITLHTVVAIFTSLASFAIAIPISSAIGQLKWLYFLRARKLAMFDRLDAASRNPFSGVILILRGRGGIPALLLALVYITILAVSPAFQAVISTRNASVTSVDPSTLSSVTALNQSSDFLSSNTLYDFNMNNVLTTRRSFYDPAPTTFTDFTCPTGNCTWPTITSLSICSTCTNISTHVTITDVTPTAPSFNSSPVTAWNVHLSNNVNLFYESSYPPNASVLAIRAGDPISFGGTTYSSIFHFFALGLTLHDSNGGLLSEPQPFASECMLQFCALTHNVTVENGQRHDLEISRWTNTSDSAKVSEEWSLQYPDLYLSPPNTTSTEPLMVSGIAWESLHGYISGHLLNSTLTFDDSQASRSTAADEASGKRIQQAPTAPLIPIPDIDAQSSALAASLSAWLRSLQPITINGTAYTSETHIHALWPWLALPAAVHILAVAGWACVAGLTAGTALSALRRPWSNSALAALMVDVDEDVRLAAGNPDRLSDVGARLVRVRGGRWRLVLGSEGDEGSGEGDEKV